MTKATLLQEAEALKERLVPVQQRLDAAAQAAQKNVLDEVAAEIGLAEAKPSHVAPLVDARVTARTPLLTPALLTDVLPVSEQSAATTAGSRAAIANIISHSDDRLVVIVGPCSIHDADSALEYAEEVKKWRKQYGGELEVVMRAYMEKPRSELGWKGLTYDPLLNDTSDLNLGLTLTRLLTCRITDMGVPIAMERLNALTPQYVNALVAYDAIGARNATDQKAREYASITSSPVGIKNPPDGSIDTTIQAIIATRAPHVFMGMSMNGAPCSMTSAGNETAHVVLRGSNSGPNYSVEHVAATKEKLAAKGLAESIIIDASHGNSGKKADNQKVVIADVAKQVAGGELAICGVMIEGNLVHGAQKLCEPADLEYGKSITDECVGLEDAAVMLAELAGAVKTRRNSLQ